MILSILESIFGGFVDFFESVGYKWLFIIFIGIVILSIFAGKLLIGG